MAEISWGGSRSNAGRKKREAPRPLQKRTVRISIYEEDHLRWKTIKKKVDKSTDPLFCKYLLEIAEKALEDG